jgi:osmotically inducible protein OsmC
MATVRTAEVEWIGDFMDGEGKLGSTSSGALGELEVTWGSRVDQVKGGTSPEELLAAAHATDFAMQLAHGLVGAGAEPEILNVSASVSFEPGRGITGSALTARLSVRGLVDEKIREVAERAMLGCPLTRALAGIDVTLDLPDLAPPPVEEDAQEGEPAVSATSSD